MMSMRSITIWKFDRQQPLQLASRFADCEGTALLYSGGGLDSARSSFLCLFPCRSITLSAAPGCWEELSRLVGPFDPEGPPIPRWVGYVGYEMGCYADHDKILPHFPSPVPDCRLYAPSVVIHFDHCTEVATLYAHQEKVSLERSPPPTQPISPLNLSSCSDTLESYLEKIERAKEWIREGEIYQVNLSQQFLLEGEAPPFALFEKIVHLNPAPFSAYIQCGTFAIVSSSPERLLSRRGDLLETRPIKGTAPRGKSPLEDSLNKETLLRSEKERAELLMITDLMRSDMGKVSLAGTVEVKEIWRCEAYTNVFHLLSIIAGRAHPALSSVSLLRSLFPGGSITGCPKLRAMEAIGDLEQRGRGIYTGSIGYFAENGDCDFNIAIRTMIVHRRSIDIQLGGAIVIDSDPVKEYEETLHKGQSLFHILGVKEVYGASVL